MRDMQHATFDVRDAAAMLQAIGAAGTAAAMLQAIGAAGTPALPLVHTATRHASIVLLVQHPGGPKP